MNSAKFHRMFVTMYIVYLIIDKNQFFWDFKRLKLAVCYRRFGTSYWSLSQRLNSPRRIYSLWTTSPIRQDRYVVQKRC
jgi:hypothetical protein